MNITKEEFTKLANRHLTALESYKIDENGNTKIEIFGIEKLYEAITVAHSSKQLKDKETPTFEEWLSNFKKTENDCYWLNKEVLYCKEAMKLHYDNLPDE